MKLTTSTINLTKKPKGKEAGLVKVSLTHQVDYNFEDLCKMVETNAFNCSLATGPKSEDWVEQSIFGLDFDSGLTISDLMKRCKRYEIVPNIIYNTFSSINNNKFRVLFLIDSPITDIFYTKSIINGLMSIFPEADTSCKDVCRMYYPGGEGSIIYLNEEVNDDNYFESVCMSQNLKKNARSFELIKQKVDVKHISIIETFNWKKSNNIKILSLFFNEQVRVSYSILFGLSTNLQYIKGGLLKLKARMKEINDLGGGQYFSGIESETRGVEKYPEEYFHTLSYIRKFAYQPMRLVSFSPFEEDYDYHNILELGFKKGEVEILKKEELMSLDEGSRVFIETFNKSRNNQPFKLEKEYGYFYDFFAGVTQSELKYRIKDADLFDIDYDNNNTIDIFKVPTALGKTQALINQTGCLIAFPNHDLKDEVKSRMIIDCGVTPRYATYSSVVINDELATYSECDLFTEASSLIKNISLGKCMVNKEVIPLTDQDIIIARKFILDNNICRRTTNTVLTTHTRALYDQSFEHKTIIFDEDPLPQLLKIGSCSLDYSKFIDSPYEEFIKDVLFKYLHNVGVGYISPMDKFKIPRGFKQYCASVKRGDIIQILESKLLFKEKVGDNYINFCRVKSLPEDKHIYIMSATVPIDIYKKLYGSRVRALNITNIKQVGIVEQYTKRSFSANSMLSKTNKYSKKVFDEILKEISSTPVITHLMASRLPEFSNNRSDFYFGKCAGFDTLNGEDISVIGTPNKPGYVYLFYAKLLDLSNNIDTEMSDQVVDWNDFRFRFFCYNDKDLRDIQLSLIESELLQACGRNRTLRMYCTTKLFSSLPLKITTQFKNK